MKRSKGLRLVLMGVSALALGACDDSQSSSNDVMKSTTAPATVSSPATQAQTTQPIQGQAPVQQSGGGDSGLMPFVAGALIGHALTGSSPTTTVIERDRDRSYSSPAPVVAPNPGGSSAAVAKPAQAPTTTTTTSRGGLGSTGSSISGGSSAG